MSSKDECKEGNKLDHFANQIYVYFPPAISTGEVTRDYTYGETDTLVKRCRLLPWINANLDEVSIVTTEPPDLYYEVKPNQLFRS